MKAQVDSTDIYELLPWQENVIKNEVLTEEFEEDMKRRIKWVWEHKFEQCYKRFEEEWIEKLRADPTVTQIPTDKEAFVNLVLARPEYKNRSERDAAQQQVVL